MNILQSERPDTQPKLGPLSPAFNVAVQTIARRLFPCGFDVAHETPGKPGILSAPATLRQLTLHIQRTGRMLVSGEHSATTIYACPETNFAFRAWHDWHHWRHQIPFTLAGERQVCAQQERDLRIVYGSRTAASFIPLLRAEVIGMAEYFQWHGEFPKDQQAFVLNWLSSPVLRARTNRKF